MSIGLVAAGPGAKACMTALRLAQRVGPVASGSFRVASRIANALRAGHAVKCYAELAGANPIVICVPDEGLPAAVEALAASGIAWVEQTVLLYSTRRDSRDLAALREGGAFAASVRPLEGVPGRFLVEGDKPAVAAARRLVQDASGRAIELEGGAAGAYLAAISFSSSLFIPVIEAAIECLRLAGVGPAEAAQLAQRLFERSLRAHRHGGRKSWSGPLAAGDEEEIVRELQALESRPLLADHYRQMSRFALELFGRHPKLLDRLSR